MILNLLKKLLSYFQTNKIQENKSESVVIEEKEDVNNNNSKPSETTIKTETDETIINEVVVDVKISEENDNDKTNNTMKISENGIKMTAHFEQYHDGDLTKIGLQPKMDPVGIWTIGLGHALVNKKTGKYLKGKSDYKLIATQYPEYLNLTYEEADNLLRADMTPIELKINKKITRYLNQDQFDALCVYFYNIGWSNTMENLLNNKATIDEIQKWWENHYITGQGSKKPLTGLVRRRKSEFYLFKTGELNYFGL